MEKIIELFKNWDFINILIGFIFMICSLTLSFGEDKTQKNLYYINWFLWVILLYIIKISNKL